MIDHLNRAFGRMLRNRQVEAKPTAADAVLRAAFGGAGLGERHELSGLHWQERLVLSANCLF